MVCIILSCSAQFALFIPQESDYILAQVTATSPALTTVLFIINFFDLEFNWLLTMWLILPKLSIWISSKNVGLTSPLEKANFYIKYIPLDITLKTFIRFLSSVCNNTFRRSSYHLIAKLLSEHLVFSLFLNHKIQILWSRK